MEESNNTQKPKPDLEKRRKINTVILSVVALIVLITILASVMGGSSKKAKYTATIDTSNIAVINPATVSLSFKVTNTGNADGQPWCTVHASDANDIYNGTDRFQLSSSIQPGQTKTSADSMTITKQGAQYVTTATISCS